LKKGFSYIPALDDMIMMIIKMANEEDFRGAVFKTLEGKQWA
jgi:hypothetical protein